MPTTEEGIGTLIGALLSRALAAYGAGQVNDAQAAALSERNRRLGTPEANEYTWSQGQDIASGPSPEEQAALQPRFKQPDKASFLQRFLAPGASTLKLALLNKQAEDEITQAQAIDKVMQEARARSWTQRDNVLFQNAHPSAESESRRLENESRTANRARQAPLIEGLRKAQTDYLREGIPLRRSMTTMNDLAMNLLGMPGGTGGAGGGVSSDPIPPDATPLGTIGPSGQYTPVPGTDQPPISTIQGALQNRAAGGRKQWVPSISGGRVSLHQEDTPEEKTRQAGAKTAATEREKPLAPKQQDEMQLLDSLTDNIGSMRKVYNPKWVNVGGVFTQARRVLPESTLGVSGEQSVFYSQLADAKDLVQRLRSGMTIPSKEMDKIESFLPKETDTPAVFEAQMERFYNAIQKRKQAVIKYGTTPRKDLKVEGGTNPWGQEPAKNYSTEDLIKMYPHAQ